MAGLVAAIGPRVSTIAVSKLAGGPSDWAALLFVLLTLAVVGEIASRRLRGAP
jgi:hypothetical protein